MKHSVSLKHNYEFRRLYAKGRCAAMPTMAIYIRRHTWPGNRIGITVTNKLGKAVLRNRIRRRLREIYRLDEPRLERGFDMVIVARGRSREASYRQLERDFRRACARLGVVRSGDEEG